MSLDLTAMLDIVLIILFAVMLNLSNSSENANEQMQEAKASYDEAKKELAESLSDQAELKESLEDSVAQLEALNTNTSNFKEITKSVVTQYQSLLAEALEISEDDSQRTQTWLKQQENADTYEEVIKQLTSHEPQTDTNALLENLHKYSVIANKFLMLDAEVAIDSGTLIFDNQKTDIIMTEEDGFDEHLFQLKSKEIAEHIGLQLETSEADFSFVLITIKYDPYITKRFYVSLISDAVDRLRDEKEHYIIFETQFLQN